MAPEEYLEGVFKDAFRRELEVDENVARTLPFFAATMALVVTLFGYAVSKLPPPALGFVSLSLHLLLGFGALCLVLVVASLFQIVRVREYRIPPKETEQIKWAEALKAYHGARGLTGPALDDQVVAALRDRMIIEYAEGAEHNREANTPKLDGRSRGFMWLVIALGIAFLMIAIIFVSDQLAPHVSMRGQDEPSRPQRPQSVPDGGKPAPAAAKVAGAPARH